MGAGGERWGGVSQLGGLEYQLMDWAATCFWSWYCTYEFHQRGILWNSANGEDVAQGKSHPFWWFLKGNEKGHLQFWWAPVKRRHRIALWGIGVPCNVCSLETRCLRTLKKKKKRAVLPLQHLPTKMKVTTGSGALLFEGASCCKAT